MTICLLGASGSIGQQTIDVINKNPKDFSLVAFSVGKRTRCISYILRKHPEVKHICISNKSKAKEYSKKYPDITFYSGDSGLLELIRNSAAEMVVNALVGFVGLLPSIEAIKCHKKLALANKESLVVGGDLINSLLKEYKGELYPIDSEHSALWKCLKVDSSDVNRLILTASGGSFRNLSREELVNVTPEDALKHPTWKMGNKITIDSATMVNKCFEIIEASYLFNYPYSKVGVTLHDESFLHSYVALKSGGYRGEISKPDMRNPIKFALYQGNIPFKTSFFHSLDDLKDLHFHPFELARFPVISFAKVVLDKKGTMGTILNRSNEEAVYAFLGHKIKFLDIEKIISLSLKNMRYIAKPSLDDILKVDQETKEYAHKLINELGGKL